MLATLNCTQRFCSLFLAKNHKYQKVLKFEIQQKELLYFQKETLQRLASFERNYDSHDRLIVKLKTGQTDANAYIWQSFELPVNEEDNAQMYDLQNGVQVDKTSPIHGFSANDQFLSIAMKLRNLGSIKPNIYFSPLTLKNRVQNIIK